jgi:hypothetical protein
MSTLNWFTDNDHRLTVNGYRLTVNGYRLSVNGSVVVKLFDEVCKVEDLAHTAPRLHADELLWTKQWDLKGLPHEIAKK